MVDGAIALDRNGNLGELIAVSYGFGDPMTDWTFDRWIDVFQTAALIGGGFWVAYTYWRFRRGQVSVGIHPTVRIHRDPRTEEPILLVRLRLRNSSRILFRYRKATATLLDASQRTDDGDLRLVPFAEDDPFIPLYSDISEDPSELSAGRTFVLGPGLSLEPGEYADTELAFLLREDELALMAMQVMVEGKQGKLGWRSYWWATFFYIDPTQDSSLITGIPEETTLS